MLDITTIHLQLPIDEIEAAIKAARRSKDEQEAVNQEAAELPTEQEVQRLKGFEGVQRLHEQRAAFDARKQKIIERAQSEIVELEQKAVAVIDVQTTPDGNDIVGENAGDFAVIEHNLVATPEQLSRILEKHNNVAFRMAASRYAADPSRNWEGFNFFDKESAVREYTAQLFDNLKHAAANPFRPVFWQYVETPTEYLRIARAYGLESEFLASGGGRLNAV